MINKIFSYFYLLFGSIFRPFNKPRFVVGIRYLLKVFNIYKTKTFISEKAKSFIGKSSILLIDDLSSIENFRKRMDKNVQKINDESYNNYIEIAYDHDINGIKVLEVVPFDYKYDKVVDESPYKRCCIFLHGGGYVFGNVETSFPIAGPIIYYSGLRTFMIDYSKAPENPFPKALNDCIEVYKYIIEELGYRPWNIVMVGISAGGSLCASMILELQRLHISSPEKICYFGPGRFALLSPWSDIDKIGDSYFTLDGYDPIISYDLNLKSCRDMYLSFDKNPDLSDEEKKKLMRNPLVSPVYGDYKFLKNRYFVTEVLITTGTRDLFLSNSVRLYQKMKMDGIEVTLDVREGMWHAYQIYGMPEGDESAKEIGKYLNGLPINS